MKIFTVNFYVSHTIYVPVKFMKSSLWYGYGFLTPVGLLCCRVIVCCRWLTLSVAIQRVPVMSLWQRAHFTWAALCAVPLAIMRCERLQMKVPVQIYSCVTLARTFTGIGVHSAVTPVGSWRQSIAIGPKSWNQSATWLLALYFLGAFVEFWKLTDSFVVSVCLSIGMSSHPPGTTRLPLDGFSWNFIF